MSDGLLKYRLLRAGQDPTRPLGEQSGDSGAAPEKKEAKKEKKENKRGDEKKEGGEAAAERKEKPKKAEKPKAAVDGGAGAGAGAGAPAAGAAAKEGGDDEEEGETGADGVKKPSKSKLKKDAKVKEALERKAKREEEEKAKREARGDTAAQAAKLIVIEEDKKLPEAKRVTIAQARAHVGQRVKIFGWAHTIRGQGSGLLFIELRDGTGFPPIIQCVLGGRMAKTYDAVVMPRETTLCVFGQLAVRDKVPGGIELQADYFKVVAMSDKEIEGRINQDSSTEQLADQRHLVLRQLEASYIMRLRSYTVQCFRDHFFDKEFVEVTPPTIVQTQVEGGSTLFKLDYFGEKAFLTQSSQLYLETVVPSLGKVFCVNPSFRAEQSRTRRHLSEYTHFEGELGFCTYGDLLDLLEDMVVDVSKRLVARAGPMLAALNPDFKAPEKKDFLRMDYKEAIEFCQRNKIYRDVEEDEEVKEGEEKKEKKKEKKQVPFEYGDDITEKPERQMTDMIGRPILLCRFPAVMKSFYMSRCAEDSLLTESVDVLMPGVGEIVGGSMRAWNKDELLAGFEREKISSDPYYWYTDLRKFGSCPHGGWGLGIERFLCWILKQDHIRNVCLYPRHIGRAKP